MIWAQTICPLILGLILVGPWESVQADKNYNLNVKNFTYGRPGNKTHNSAPVTSVTVDNALYMKYACQSKQNGLRLPIEGSCTQYLECQQGSAKLMQCKEGKHFSSFGLACIDARLSKCSVKCEGPCCDKEDGLHPDVTNCANFIVCVKGEAHRQSCGDIFKFNSEKLICDIPERTKCLEVPKNNFIERKIESPSNFSKPTMYMISHRVCRGKSNGKTVGIPGSCNKFYFCANGEGYLKSCGNLQFNAARSFCDTRTRIYCPEFEMDDVILAEDEYPLIDELSNPWLRPTMPIPPVAVEEGTKTQQKPAVPENDKFHGSDFWNPKPVDPENVDKLQPPHRVPGKPFPEKQLSNGEHEIHPPAIGQVEHPHWEPSVPMPHFPENYEKPEKLPYYPPYQKPQVVPQQPAVDPIPVPPNVFNPDLVEEIIDPMDYASLCADESVGALIAMPNHCNKYIRCKWNWFERRVAEIVSCPKNKHFNAKNKLCTVPEKAGCIIPLN